MTIRATSALSRNQEARQRVSVVDWALRARCFNFAAAPPLFNIERRSARSTMKPRKAAVAFIFITVTLDMLALGLIIPVLPTLVLDFLGDRKSTRLNSS